MTGFVFLSICNHFPKRKKKCLYDVKSLQGYRVPITDPGFSSFSVSSSLSTWGASLERESIDL